MSAESGIPTFRDAIEGLWKKCNPMELATPKAFARHPRVVSRWYDERRVQCASCRPNPGHFALAELERRVTARGGRFALLFRTSADERAVSAFPAEVYNFRALRDVVAPLEAAGFAVETRQDVCDAGTPALLIAAKRRTPTKDAIAPP